MNGCKPKNLLAFHSGRHPCSTVCKATHCCPAIRCPPVSFWRRCREATRLELIRKMEYNMNTFKLSKALTNIIN